jgi:hypothetical protein
MFEVSEKCTTFLAGTSHPRCHNRMTRFQTFLTSLGRRRYVLFVVGLLLCVLWFLERKGSVVLEPVDQNSGCVLEIYSDNRLDSDHQVTATQLLANCRDKVTDWRNDTLGFLLSHMHLESGNGFRYWGSDTRITGPRRLVTTAIFERGVQPQLRLKWGRYLIAIHQQSECGYYGASCYMTVQVSASKTSFATIVWDNYKLQNGD